MIQKRKEEFWDPAAKFISRNYGGDAAVPTISPGTPEWGSWLYYFMGHLGWSRHQLPSIMREITAGTRGDGKNMMTVPHLNPKVFDPRWKGLQSDKRHELRAVES